MNNRSIVWELVGALTGIVTVVLIVISVAVRVGDGLKPSKSSIQIGLDRVVKST